MAIPWPRIAEGTRVKVMQGAFPQDAAVIGRSGTVVSASEYHPWKIGVTLDGSGDVHYFAPEELQVTAAEALPADRESAKLRRVLP